LLPPPYSSAIPAFGAAHSPSASRRQSYPQCGHCRFWFYSKAPAIQEERKPPKPFKLQLHLLLLLRELHQTLVHNKKTIRLSLSLSLSSENHGSWKKEDEKMRR